MIYLLNKFDLDIFELDEEKYVGLELWETGEPKVKGWIENERTRTIMDKVEVVNLFNIQEKVQMGKVSKINLKKYDKIVVWTPEGKYYAFRVLGIYE